MNEAVRSHSHIAEQIEVLECLLTVCSNFKVSTGGFGLQLLCPCSKLLSSSLQHSADCTLRECQCQYSKHPRLKWLHQIQQGEGARESYAFRSSCFRLWPAHFALSLFSPTQIVIPYLGEGRRGKKRACDERVWCGYWKEFSKFLPPPLRMRQGRRKKRKRRTDKYPENSAVLSHGVIRERRGTCRRWFIALSQTGGVCVLWNLSETERDTEQLWNVNPLRCLVS